MKRPWQYARYPMHLTFTPASHFTPPAGLPERPPSTRELIARVENIDVADIRLKTEIDPRIGHLVVLKWDILSRLKRMAKGFIGLK